MSDIIFEALKLIVMFTALILTRYLVPWIKNRLEMDKIDLVASWASKAVLMAQQTLTSAANADKKIIVTDFLKKILTAKNISLSDEQLNVLIEAAVKQMKDNQEDKE